MRKWTLEDYQKNTDEDLQDYIDSGEVEVINHRLKKLVIKGKVITISLPPLFTDGFGIVLRTTTGKFIYGDA